MNPHYLESLYLSLGSPCWFWPLVFILLFAMMVLGSSISTE